MAEMGGLSLWQLQLNLQRGETWGKRTTELIRRAELSVPLNGAAPTNKRNGLAISRIDGEDCFIRDDKTDRAGAGRVGEGSREAGKAGEGEKGTTDRGQSVTPSATDTPRVTHT